MAPRHPEILVIGAGMGGLSAALRLAARGARVTVIEKADHPGGKMRAVASAAGPVDAGPTVLTMRYVFDELFADAGARLEDYAELLPEPLLARHWWPDGSQLDLFADFETSLEAVRDLAGKQDADGFAAFCRKTRALFAGFDAPMMRNAEPSLGQLTAHVLQHPDLIAKMAPLRTLAGDLARHFKDHRLRQLFGRYATYVGGSPYTVPALLGLIWASEEAGVWRVRGGMHQLAAALAQRAEEIGVAFQYGTAVQRIERQDGRAAGIVLSDGQRIASDAVVFNGDPKAIYEGGLGEPGAGIRKTAVSQRSYSAYVWSFAAEARGLELAHHNVFFGGDPKREFDELDAGEMPSDPTLYICAQDRGEAADNPRGPERFEIIMNGPPARPAPDREFETCRNRTMRRLACQGLTFSPEPGPTALMTPNTFGDMFPASDGSLYGRSPAGMMAAFQRPKARTELPGLYLAGGGTHPGAGVPMACLSGKHAAEAISNDLALTSTSHQTVTRGGMSMGSKTVAGAPSRSLGS